MHILGINAYHGDASAALVSDGQLVSAIEEERFNRIKHWAGFPSESIRYCLETAGITIADVDHVAISFNPRANLHERLRFVAHNRPSIAAVLNRIRRQKKTLSLHQQLADSCGCTPAEITADIHRIEHHQTHVAAGFLISPYERAAVLSVDGMGDFVSTMTAFAEGTQWQTIDRTYYPHSLGFLYNAVTLYLGFPHYGDEYKVMGLAPYGEPEYLELFRDIVRPVGDGFELNLDYFTHHKKGIQMNWNGGAPTVEPFHSPLLERKLGPPRDRTDQITEKHENIARSLQAVTEEMITHLLTCLHDLTNCPNVCLTGGVAMNSVANGKITTETPFENAWMPAGAADNGTAFGAAFYVHNKLLKHPRTFVQTHAYLGTEWDDDACADACRAEGEQFETHTTESLVETVVDAIIDGKVVGWFQGRMEFGARALGNRSLIADPRRTDMRDLINLKIKFREKFRPFAPSILEEHVSEWFEINEPSPYMEKVFPVRREKHSVIPAVTHVDGSGRLQTVSKKDNPLYHKLISAFHERTGVPILVNTSLNENEPIVRTPNEAIRCYQRTAMDIIVVGHHLVRREEQSGN